MSFSQYLDVGFKGARDYLAGTDIFDSVSTVVNERFGGFVESLVFRRLATNCLALVSKNNLDQRTVVCEVRLGGVDGEEPIKLLVVEGDEPVHSRRDFDEARIANACEVSLENRSVEKARDSEFSVIEELVAAHKVLCDAIAPGNGKWVFTQLNLSCSIALEVASLKLVNKRCLSGKLVLSEIFLNESSVGFIRFVRS